jgi:hypothetical protein
LIDKLKKMEDLNKINWHDSPIKLLVFDCANGVFELDFAEFGSMKEYKLSLNEAVLLESVVEGKLDFCEMDIGSVKINLLPEKNGEIEVGIIGRTNGYMGMKFSFKTSTLTRVLEEE